MGINLVDNAIRIYNQETIRQMAAPPVLPAVGCCMCNDERGTDKWVFMIFSASSFWRYNANRDTYQQLTSPPTTVFSAGMTMVFDPSYGAEGTVWLYGMKATAGFCSFAAYDVATDAWTSKALPTLAGAWTIDSALVHTCTSYNAAGNDDLIYLIGNNATVMYTYTISTDTWAVTGAPTALPAAAGAGCSLIWTWNSNPDNLLFIRGTATSAMYNYSISTDTWSTVILYVPRIETFTTGTYSVYHPLNDSVYIFKESTKRVYMYDIVNQKLRAFQTMTITPGTSVVGQKGVFISSYSRNYLYFIPHSQRLLRSECWDSI